MQGSKFQRKIEDFVCSNCGTTVEGNGYTNHCPKCLWSKHVDVAPGDRSAACGGLMEPIRIEGTAKQYRLLHLCQRCGREALNNASHEDDPDALIAIAKRS